MNDSNPQTCDLTRDGLYCILPPYVLEQIRRRGTEQQRELATAALARDTSLRDQRAATPAIPSVPSGPLGLTPEKSRAIHGTRHTHHLPGRLVRDEGDGPTGDADVDRVYDGFGATWDLYFDVFGRNSYDDAGAALVGTVHYGVGYDNAFWNGTQMVFGDGDGSLFVSFTSAIDIIGHELTHAVTSFESDLAYSDQSGALNESLSDVFGSLVKQRDAGQTADQADWLIGAGIFGPDVTGVALRSMSAPGTAYDDDLLGKDPQPAHMDSYVDTDSDNGGVHINSGIPNHAFYRFAVALGGYAWETAGHVWYAAATDDSMTPTSDFQAFADLTADRAQVLFGAEVAQSCAEAWAGVGITVTAPLADESGV
ncbi:MAG TPA: M4 family metallopeptidase [Nocardioides sp.]|jgi:Zn-dependent metalloprotease